MTTLRKYVDVVKAEMDKSLLEAAGIPAFIAGENSATIGYGGILAEIHLQVQDADADRARQVLQDNKDATPLSDDFIPPEAPPCEKSELGTADPENTRIVWSVIVTLLVVFAMFVAFGLWNTSHSAAAYYRSGYMKWGKGNFDGSIADYTKAIELNFKHLGRAYNGRGLAEWSKGDLDSAITDYDIAIALDPKGALAYVNRGIAERTKGNLDSAVADFNTAIEFDPKNAIAYCGRGVVKRDKDNLEDALADFDKAIQLYPKYAHAYENRAYTKRKKGDLDGAISDYDRAIELDPKEAQSYDGRAFVKRIEGRLDGAIADYTQAVTLDPKHIDAYYGRGVAHYDERDWNNALFDFRKATALKPTSPRLETLRDYSRIRIWMTRAKLGDHIAATEELKQYLLTRTVGKPGDWPSIVIHFLTGDLSDNDFLKAAVNSDEKQTRNQKCEAYYYAGTLRLINGDKSTATDYFSKCIDTGATQNYEYRSAAAELEALRQ